MEWPQVVVEWLDSAGIKDRAFGAWRFSAL